MPDDRDMRLAVVATIYRYLSHAQHFADRFLVGYPYEGRWRRSPGRIVSLHVDQSPEGDQGADRAREFGFEVYPTVAEALRCGGGELAVDGVLIIGEHGEYPDNELGQKLYPRYEMFKECVAVFEADGRAVPVYNDKHLSYSFDYAREMVEDGAPPRIPDPGRVLPAGHLEAAGPGAPVRHRHRGGADDRRRRLRRHGLPRPSRRCSA